MVEEWFDVRSKLRGVGSKERHDQMGNPDDYPKAERLTMRTKLKAAVIVVSLGIIAVICVLFASRRGHDDRVSLSFQRYSDHDLYVDHMAYLWLTNASNKTYLLSEPGNTNTIAMGNLFHPERISCMVDCEFSDETPSGWSNWMQQPPLS
jgi:hypothetical protein